MWMHTYNLILWYITACDGSWTIYCKCFNHRVVSLVAGIQTDPSLNPVYMHTCMLSNRFYLNVDPVAGGLADQPRVIAGIVIAAVLFALLNLITFAVIVCYVHSHSKKGKSACIVYENNHTNDGDLQSEYHQLERSQSHEHQLISKIQHTLITKAWLTMSQESDRHRFLKRAVRRPFFKTFKRQSQSCNI